jgi:hypothetical protein
MDFRPTSFKVHIVHIRFHQQDAAPMFRKKVRHESITFSLSEVKSFSLIRYDDGYLLAGPTAAPDVYFCSWMFVIAVHNGIPQSLAERQFDTELFARNTLRTFNQQHYAFHQW